MTRNALWSATALVCAAASCAEATWSIVIVNRRTGEVAVGSATCLTDFDLRAGTPVVLTGLGAATAQSSVDSTGLNRMRIRDGLATQTAPATILSGLATFDGSHQSRQYGIVDTLGRAVTFTGTGAGTWAGGRTGDIGDLTYAVQGNVLAGAAVVDRAVDAIILTPGDLPAKLMAAMEAARAMGGDGRCSCGVPADACGAPPPSFTHSANIAYMIIARTGDRDAANGIYRSPSTVVSLATSPDQGPGVVSDLGVLSSLGFAAYLRNQMVSAPRSPYPLFGPVTSSVGSLSQARDLALARMNSDGLLDVVAAGGSASLSGVQTSLQNANGTFGAAVRSPTAAGAAPMFLADLNGDGRRDVVVTTQPSGFVTFLVGANGALSALDTFTQSGTQGARSVAAADFSGDGAPDVAMADSAGSRVLIFQNRNDGTGRLELASPAATIALAASPTTIEAGDFNGDGRIDLAAGTAAATNVLVLTNTASGLVAGGVAVPFSPGVVRTGDVNNDGLTDIVCVGSNTIGVLWGAPGGPALDRTYRYIEGFFSFPVSDLRLGHMDGDGYLDIAGYSLQTMLIIQNQGRFNPGRFTDRIGCAAGDYFMNFNHAFAQATDPDPVLLLQQQYNAWRTALVGVPDAVQSTVQFDRPCLIAGGPRTEMTVTLLDWQGAPATDAGLALQVRHARGSAGAAVIGAPAALGGGRWSVPISGPANAPVGGTDLFEITVLGGVRPVVLMPFASVRLAAPADYNRDGLLDGGDVAALADDIARGERALPENNPDINNDGGADNGDIIDLAAAIERGGCL